VIAIEEYRDIAGRSRFSEWFDSLDLAVAARINTVLARLSAGHTSALKSLGEGLLEYRIDSGPGYRIYLAKDGDRLILLFGGGTKKHQNADIAIAKKNWNEYKKRKKTSGPYLLSPMKRR
jgi:putative addiction module killer protein